MRQFYFKKKKNLLSSTQIFTNTRYVNSLCIYIIFLYKKLSSYIYIVYIAARNCKRKKKSKYPTNNKQYKRMLKCYGRKIFLQYIGTFKNKCILYNLSTYSLNTRKFAENMQVLCVSSASKKKKIKQVKNKAKKKKY